MKNLIALASFLFLAFLSNAQSTDEVSLTVDINGLKPKKQFVVFAELRDEANKVTQRQKVPCDKTTMTIVFDKVRKGKYVFRFFLDENGNEKLDFNFFGAPSESWGYSNDARGFLSAPKFEDALFTLDTSKRIAVTSEN